MPKDLFPSIKSGFFIALIAMPLCLGIAIASQFPPIAGILTAIVGGLIVSLVGGCELSIKGPAAGLIVIMMGAVSELGAGDIAVGYQKCLAVGVVAACLQIIFALLKTARFGRLMPPSVIHGMLAAIGVIIIAKQIHILVGALPHGHSTIELIAEIPNSIIAINPELAFIGIFTVICLVALPMIPSRTLKPVPPALLALMVVVPLGLLWHLDVPHAYRWLDSSFEVGPKFLVNIPDNILNSLIFPDFSALTNPLAYKYVLMMALVGSIESVLTVIAVDSLANSKKKSDLNRDLLGIGIGNLICSFIGGLPMISEVVRSKANIDNGAKNRWSNFFHGAFLLIAIVWAAPLIREIPLAALAAMLIVTGMRLASPSMFFKTYKIGSDQLAIFLTTLSITLMSDLLLGVVAGLSLKLAFHVYRGVKMSYLVSVPIKYLSTDSETNLIINGPAVFSNYFSVQKHIYDVIATNKKVVVDFSEATLVDHTTLSCLYSLLDELGDDKLALTGLDKLRPISEHNLSTHKLA